MVTRSPHSTPMARKARATLGWAPKVGFEELVAMMVDADLARLSARR